MSEKIPRRWSRPQPPADVRRVRGLRSGRTYEAHVNARGRTLWRPNGLHFDLTWGELLEEERDVVEVVETEVEAAARRLREQGFANPTGPVRDLDDTQIVLAHVLNGGTL